MGELNSPGWQRVRFAFHLGVAPWQTCWWARGSVWVGLLKFFYLCVCLLYFNIFYIFISTYIFNYIYVCVCVCVSCSVISNSLWPRGLYLARLLCPWDSPGKNTGVGCHSLLQGIFPTQGLNPGLLHCGQILYHLSHQGSPYMYYIHLYICLGKPMCVYTQTFACVNMHIYIYTLHKQYMFI